MVEGRPWWSGLRRHLPRPDEKLTRAQLAALAVLVTRQSQDRLPELRLTDVQPTDWFYRAVLSATEIRLRESSGYMTPSMGTATISVTQEGERFHSHFASGRAWRCAGHHQPGLSQSG